MVLGNFQRQGILIIRIKVGQGLLVCVGGVALDIFSYPYHIAFLSPSL